MANTAAEVLIDTLYDWGVEVVFGLPRWDQRHHGGTARTPGPIRFVQVRHEEAAALAACGYAKVTAG